MTSWCIVAIPEESDPVWQTSSEKIPHCTLLFLGDQDDNEKAMLISQQLQHTVDTSLKPFYMDVHSRGTLGDKDADVLFFDQANVPKQLTEFRSLLLKDETIRVAYDSVEQYPSWTPHLTLGYPDSPAKKPLVDPMAPFANRFHSIYFDRIALWIYDYDGPTFKMKYDDMMSEASDVFMSDQTKHFLSHRKEKPMRPENKLKHYGFGGRAPVYTNPIQTAILPALRTTLESTKGISSDSRYLAHAAQGGLLEGNPLRDQYIRENQLALTENLKKTFKGLPSETANQRFSVATTPSGDWVLSSIDTLAHAGTAETLIHPVLDDQGLITDYVIVHNDVSQSDLSCAIMHYGTKGMKWGIRRKSKDSDSGSASGSGESGGSGGKAGGAGGAAGEAKKPSFKEQKESRRKHSINQAVKEQWKKPVAEEAASAESSRKIIKKHGTDALTNKELKDAVERMNLEQQYANLQANAKAASVRGSGQAYVKQMFKEAGSELGKEVIKFGLTQAVKYVFSAAMGTDGNSGGSGTQRTPSTRGPELTPSQRALGQRQRELN